MATLDVSGNNASYTLTLSGMSTSTRYHVFITDLDSDGSVNGYRCIRSSLGSSSTWRYDGSSNPPYSNHKRLVYVYTSTAPTVHSVGTTYDFEDMRSGCTFMTYDTIEAATPTYTYHSVTIQTGAGVDYVMVSYTKDGNGATATIRSTDPSSRGTIIADVDTNVYVVYVAVTDSTLYGAPYIATSYTSGFTSVSHSWEFSSFSSGSGNDIQVNGNRYIDISASRKTNTFYGRLVLNGNGGTFSNGRYTEIDWPRIGYQSATNDSDYAYIYITLPSDGDTTGTPELDGYMLKGWATDDAATSVDYSIGGTVRVTAKSMDATNPTEFGPLYAVWEKNYTGSLSLINYYYDADAKTTQGIAEFGVSVSTSNKTWTLRAQHGTTGTSASITLTSSGSVSLKLPFLYQSSAQTYTVTLIDPDGATAASIVINCKDMPVYTLTFNANGGTGAPDSLTTKANVAKVTIPATKPRRLKYKFLGWGLYSNSDSPVVSVSELPYEYVLTVNRTLYAVWEAIDTIELFTWTGKDTTDATMIKKGEPVKDVITAAKWNELLLRVKALVEGCGLTFDYTLVSKGSDITAAQFNNVRLGLAKAGTALNIDTSGTMPGAQQKGYTMYASLFNGGGSIKSSLNYLIGVYNDA